MFLQREVKADNYEGEVHYMELTEWQIILISTAVGSAVPLVLIVLREIYQERKRGRQIRKILIGELSSFQDVLKEALSTGKIHKKDKEHVIISEDMPIFDSFPLDTTCYDDMEIETLAKYVKVDTLKLLQKAYRMTYHYNQSFMRVIGARWIDIKLTKELLEQIDETIKALN